MTVKLLTDRPPYVVGNLYTADAATEAELVASGIATIDLTGGTAYEPPVAHVAIGWTPLKHDKTIEPADDGRRFSCMAPITITWPAGMVPRPNVQVMPPASGSVTLTGNLNGRSGAIVCDRAGYPGGIEIKAYEESDGYGVTTAAGAGASSFSQLAGNPTDNTALAAALNDKLSSAHAWHPDTNDLGIVSGTPLSGLYAGINAVVNVTAGTTALSPAIDGITSTTKGDVWVYGWGGTTTWSIIPSTAIVGIFATTAALQTAYPAANSPGGMALVGSGAPYAIYFSNAGAWIKQVQASTDLTDWASVQASITAAGANQSGVLAQSGIDILVPPSYTVSTSAGVTFNTALDNTYGGSAARPGLYVYYEANSVNTGQAAGHLWTVMIDTTHGTVYQDRYTPGTNPQIPSSPTPWGTVSGGTGAGIYDAVVLQATVSANAMGKHGRLQYNVSASGPSNTNQKHARVSIGGTTFSAPDLLTLSTTTQVRSGARASMWNVGTTGAQHGYTDSGVNSPYWWESTVDTTAAFNTAIHGVTSVATDWILFSFASIMINPAN